MFKVDQMDFNGTWLRKPTKAMKGLTEGEVNKKKRKVRF
jgi:hypothetical protein